MMDNYTCFILRFLRHLDREEKDLFPPSVLYILTLCIIDRLG